MRILSLAAVFLILGILLSGPVLAEAPQSAVTESKAGVVENEPLESKDLVEGRYKQTGKDADISESNDVKGNGEKEPAKVEATGVEGSEKATEVGGKKLSKGKSVDAKEADKPRRVLIEVPEDRRWIIKQHTLEGMKISEEKPAPIKWEDEEQKARCEPMLSQLKDNFLKARYYSIQGDPCVTAKYAKEFLKSVDICEKECPAEFLDKRGYDRRVIKNLNTLYKLGTDGCLK